MFTMRARGYEEIDKEYFELCSYTLPVIQSFIDALAGSFTDCAMGSEVTAQNMVLLSMLSPTGLATDLSWLPQAWHEAVFLN